MRGAGERKGRRAVERRRAPEVKEREETVSGAGKFKFLYISTSSSVYFTSSVVLLFGLVL